MKRTILICLCTALSGLAMAQVKQPVSPSDSLFRLGYRYYKKNPAAPGLAGARSCFLAAARLGSARAMEMLGELYDDSLLLRIGDSAVVWFQKAAVAGNAKALFKLGWIYETGRHDHAQDFSQAADYFYKGMLAGNAGCKNKIAYFLYKGFLGRQNYDSAYLLFSQLAYGGSDRQSNSMYFLSLCYRNGYGTPRNTDSADFWLRRSAKANECQAQLELAAATPDNPLVPLGVPVTSLSTSGQSFRRVTSLLPSTYLDGVYTGYVLRYDWSGQHLTSISPLQATWHKDRNTVSGSWNEGEAASSFQAMATDSGLLFNNTLYEKKLHYSKGSGESWEFRDGDLQWMVQGDSTIITGVIRVYSPSRKEPGIPLNVHLSRIATIADKELDAGRKAAFTVSPNPFHESAALHFTLTGTQHVIMRLMTMQGQLLRTEDLGWMGPGEYTQSIPFPPSTSAGAYVVSLNMAAYGGRAVIIKQ